MKADKLIEYYEKNKERLYEKHFAEEQEQLKKIREKKEKEDRTDGPVKD